MAATRRSSTNPDARRTRGRWVRSTTLRLCQADPEVASFGLYSDADTGAMLLWSDGAPKGPLPATRREPEPAAASPALTVRRVATAEGLVAATNQLLARLELPFRLVPLLRTDGVVVCVSVRTTVTKTLPPGLDFDEPLGEVDEILDDEVDPYSLEDDLRDVA